MTQRIPGQGPHHSPTQSLERARQDIKTRSEKLRDPKGADVQNENQRSVQSATDTYQRLQQVYQQEAMLQQTNPWQQSLVAQQEYQLFQAAQSNPELARELQLNGQSFHTLLMAQAAGIDFDRLRELAVVQGAMAMQGGNAAYAEYIAGTMERLESAQSLLPHYDQAVNTTPAYQRPKDAQPARPKWKQKLDHLKDGLKGKASNLTTQNGATSTQSTPAASTASKPIAMPTVDALKSQHNVSSTEAVDAHRTLRSLGQTGEKTYTLYLKDDGNDGAIIGQAARKLANIGKDADARRIQIGGKGSAEFLEKHGLRRGAGPEVDALAVSPGESRAKVILDVSKTPPKISVDRTGPQRVDFYAGSIDNFAEELLKRANTAGRPLVADFNGLDLVAKPGDDKAKVMEPYHHQLHSPKALVAREEEQMKIDAMERGIKMGAKKVNIHGGTIDGFAVELARQAKSSKGPLVANYNGLDIVAKPGDDPSKIKAQWDGFYGSPTAVLARGTLDASRDREDQAIRQGAQKATLSGNIDDIVQQLMARAKASGKPQVMMYNDVALIAGPGDTDASKIRSAWDDFFNAPAAIAARQAFHNQR
jgi:hypothetical protein